MSAGRSNKTLKIVDRYIGTALLAPLALRPKRALNRGTVRRIGLMKTAAIGDTLLLAGLIGDVRAAYPSASVILITGEDNRGAVNLLPDTIDEHIVVTPRRPLSSVRSVRDAHLDVLADFGSWPRFDALIAALSGAKFILGFRTPGQFRHYGFDKTVPHGLVHERENYVRLLAELGIHATAAPAIRAARMLAADRYPSGPYMVFHPWASGHLHQAREWPTERWLELADWVQSLGCIVVLSGAPSERSAGDALAARLAETGATVVNAAGRFTLAELVDLLVGSRAVVSVNTGIAHMASLAGAPTVSLQGPTSSARWGPLGPRVRLVDSTLPGCGYLNLGFEYAGQRLDCMAGISAESVIAAIESLLKDGIEEVRAR
ncbi:MAG TPA: glycosyltransferase family 9 protein [Gemmatimonadaceae bacterium]|jgi:heptosyltransferase I